MCKDLVFYDSENLLKKEVVSDTLKIARDFKGGDHRIVLRDLRNLKKKIKELPKKEKDMYKIVPISYQDSMNRKQTKYNLNFNAYSLLVMGYTGKKAVEFKSKYIYAFNLLIEENKSLRLEYEKSKVIRLDFTDTIKKLVPEASHWTYSNLTRLAYKVALNKYPNEIKKEKGAKKSESAKLYLTQEEIIKVEKMETKFELLTEMGKSYQEIKDMYIK